MLAMMAAKPTEAANGNAMLASCARRDENIHHVTKSRAFAHWPAIVCHSPCCQAHHFKETVSVMMTDKANENKNAVLASQERRDGEAKLGHNHGLEKFRGQKVMRTCPVHSRYKNGFALEMSSAPADG